MSNTRSALASALLGGLALAGCATSPANPDAEVATKESVERTKLTYPTYRQDDIVGKAGNFFGKSSAGVAELIGNVFAKQGEPSAYIAGEQAGGAIGVGVTYGKGLLYRPGQEPVEVFWQGPSIGFDVGADASKVFTLVYGLDDIEKLYQRFPGGEGNFYLVGGIAAEAMSIGDITIVPVRTGVGARAGVKAGYMAFSKQRNVLPF